MKRDRNLYKRSNVPIVDGITIMEGGTPEKPEVHIIVKAPGANFAPRLKFGKHEALTDIIEQLITYRRAVFPDAPEINLDAEIQENRKL